MKLTRRQLNEIIHRSLGFGSHDLLSEIASKGEIEAIKSAIGDLKGSGLDESQVAVLTKGIEKYLEKGPGSLAKALAASPKATSLLVKHVPSLGGITAGALGLFGAFSVVSGAFSVLPTMIKRSLDNLSSIEGSILNFYRIKNIQEIGTDKPQKPITWDEYGDSSGAAAQIVKDWGIKIRTKKEIAMVLAASKMTGDGENDIMAKIEKAGLKKYGRDEGYQRIFDRSFYKEISKVRKKLAASDDTGIANGLLKEIYEAVRYKDNRKLGAFADLFSQLA